MDEDVYDDSPLADINVEVNEEVNEEENNIDNVYVRTTNTTDLNLNMFSAIGLNPEAVNALADSDLPRDGGSSCHYKK